MFSIVLFLFYVFCHSFSYLFLLIWKASNILNYYVATIVHALLLAAKPRFSCNDWERFQSYLLISYWFLLIAGSHPKFLIVKETVSCGFDHIARFILVQWTRPCMTFYITGGFFENYSGFFFVFILRIGQNRPYKKYLINLVHLVITGKSQTSSSLDNYIDLNRQGLGLRFYPCNDHLTLSKKSSK